jgi:hypothetical protein
VERQGDEMERGRSSGAGSPMVGHAASQPRDGSGTIWAMARNRGATPPSSARSAGRRAPSVDGASAASLEARIRKRRAASARANGDAARAASASPGGGSPRSPREGAGWAWKADQSGAAQGSTTPVTAWEFRAREASPKLGHLSRALAPSPPSMSPSPPRTKRRQRAPTLAWRPEFPQKPEAPVVVELSKQECRDAMVLSLSALPWLLDSEATGRPHRLSYRGGTPLRRFDDDAQHEEEVLQAVLRQLAKVDSDLEATRRQLNKIKTQHQQVLLFTSLQSEDRQKEVVRSLRASYAHELFKQQELTLLRHRLRQEHHDVARHKHGMLLM